MAIPARRVSQLKTIAAVRGTGTHSNERHTHHFQIASLELEKTRHVRERATALARVAVIEARIAEIEASIQKHNEALGVAEVSPPGSDAEPKGTAGAAGDKRRTLRY